MIIIFSIFLLIILLILTSKLKINVKYIEKSKKLLKIDFDIKIEIFILSIIKITLFSIKRDGIYILFFKIPYNKFKFDKDAMQIVKEISIFDIFRCLNIRLEKFNLELDLGTESPAITAFLVFVVATVFSVISAKYQKNIKYNNFYYKINPIYNANILEFKFNTKISSNLFNIIKLVYFLKSNSKAKKSSTKLGLVKI